MENRKWLRLRLLGAALCLVAAVVVAYIASAGRDKPPETMREYYEGIYDSVMSASSCNYIQYTFDGLMYAAHTVAIVTPLDELTRENTFGIAESGDRYYNIHSVRKLKAVRYFKNELGYGDTIEIAEQCGLAENNRLVMEEDNYPMQKDVYYLVFLGKSGFKYPLVKSFNNGKFDLTHLSLNVDNYKHVLVDALIGLELLEPECLEKYASQLDGATGLTPVPLYPEEYKAVDNAASWSGFELYTEYTLPKYRFKLYASDEGGRRLYKFIDCIYSRQDRGSFNWNHLFLVCNYH